MRWAPIGRWPLALLALTPMAVTTRASLSADAITTALAFLLLALVARMAWGSAPRRRDPWLLLVVAMALCLTKLPYAGLLVALAVVPRQRLGLRRRRRFWALFVGAVALAAAFSVWTASRTSPRLRAGTESDRNRQLQEIVSEPVRFALLVVVHYATSSDRYAAQLVGAQLGWLDVKIPLPLIASYLVALLALIFFAGGRGGGVERWQRLVLGAAALLVAVLVAASQYAVWTELRAELIEGLQGRYFLPAAPLAVWALHRRRREPPATALGWGLAAYYAVVTLVVCWRAVERYYG